MSVPSMALALAVVAVALGGSVIMSAFVGVVVAVALVWLLTLIPGDAQIKQIGRVVIIVALVLYLLNLFVGFV